MKPYQLRIGDYVRRQGEPALESDFYGIVVGGETSTSTIQVQVRRAKDDENTGEPTWSVDGAWVFDPIRTAMAGQLTFKQYKAFESEVNEQVSCLQARATAVQDTVIAIRGNLRRVFIAEAKKAPNPKQTATITKQGKDKK